MAMLYKLDWQNRHLTADATTVGEMADALELAAKQLREMAAEGVTLDPDGGAGEDSASLSTTDPHVAKRFGMAVEPPKKKAGGFAKKPAAFAKPSGFAKSGGYKRKGPFGRG